ncbi:hypothetical protein HYZ76_01210 [Candidatus Falkowbacteria bacterium]|nr:hypothetical protein [Candidatus Falkowbacteria bacterium]
MKIPNLKLSRLKGSKSFFKLRHLYGLVVILAIIALGYLGYFLNEMLYKTIAQTEEVILLKKEVAPDAIDIAQVDKILKEIDEKGVLGPVNEFGGIKNPFSLKLNELPPVEEPITEEN